MSNIHIVNLSENYARPKEKEDEYRGFVTNGKNNEFFQTLISAYKGSVTHSSICNSYVQMTIGRGLGVLGEDIDSPKNKELKLIISDKDIDAMVNDFVGLGAYAGQVHVEVGNNKKIAKIEHIDASKLAPSIRNEKGLITSYWYSYDWEQEYKYPPTEYDVFGYGDGSKPQIFVKQPYEIGGGYFSAPKWSAALQYAQLEEEISNFNITHIKRGLSFGSVIGVPNSDHWADPEKKQYVTDLKENGTGSSNAGATNIIFLSGNEPIHIANVENNTAHEQWELLIKECKNQILTAHGCPSPSLIGMPPSTGFSSSADEMDAMFLQLQKNKIIPFQEWICKGLDEELEKGGIDTKTQFISLIDEDEKKEEEVENNPNAPKKEIEEEEEKKETLENSELADFIAKGENIDRLKYDVIQEIEVDYTEEEELENAKIEKSLLSKFIQKLAVSTGIARPNSKSEQDSDDIIIRYKYVGNPNPERDFCKAMMKADKVYRKEDILQLSTKVVNPGFGFGDGSKPYSIWLYKGGGKLTDKFKGGTCKHKWNRVIYLKKGKNVDVNSPLAKTISTSEARRRGYKVPTNENIVSIAPHDI